MNFITRMLAKYLGPKFAVQYASTLAAYLNTAISAFLISWGITGAGTYVEQLVSGLVGLLVLIVSGFFTAKFDSKQAEARPETPVIPSKGK